MTANSKWITVESLEEPVTRVARRALKSRLRWLWSRLPLAAEAADQDLEHVHQLRVASRRATAAMETFAPYLPPRRGAWFDRQLKRIRKAAGEARDLDVLAVRLEQEFNGDASDAAIAIIGRLSAARAAAQPEIVDVYRRLQSREFRQRIRWLVHRVRMRETCDGAPCGDSCGDVAGCDSNPCGNDCQCECEPSIFQAARGQMHQLVDAWFAAANADLSDTHHLHLFRIAGKQLRYAMEIFAAAIGSNFRKTLYPQVEEILEQLGRINDHVTSQARFQTWLNETDQPDQRNLLTRLLSSDDQAIASGLHAFFQLWTTEHRNALRAQFAHELADH
jgi:CHAD domain-containing protein